MATPPPLVVLVDDDIDHAVIVRTILASVAPDIPVQTLTDVRDVDVRLRAVTRDALILIDRMLGATESISLIGPLHLQRPDLRIVLMSSSLSAVDAERACEAGAAGAVEKPGNLDGWRGLLKTMIGGESADGSAAVA